ncbi:MAG: transglycosylase domain-containing protein [Ruminococcus sp.]|nr:transglycosylase domain-containing protein [Ruminococcus sp.]
MRETDISKFTDHNIVLDSSKHPVKRVMKAIGRALFTALMVIISAGVIVGISLTVYIVSIANEPTGINLKAKSVNQTSFIYVKNSKGNFSKYQSLYDSENRVWVDFKKIPQHMKDAVIAIEDKRFPEHNGVDWTRTFGAVLNLASGKSSYGGSTLTQQLIKNISDDNEVSLNRKIREIVRALKLETEYTKDEILEAYLNVVNFGNNCQGVQSAANLYFGKNIDKCSLAQCAAIASITQNPSKYNPLTYPEENKTRRDVVLYEMLDQQKITDDEYREAIKESDKLKFVGFKKSNKTTTVNTKVQNWYMDELQNDLTKDLAVYYNISEKAASDKLFTEGLKIYSAMDKDMQNYLEDAAMNLNSDDGLQCAATLIDLNGAVIATTGSSREKTSNLLFDRATDSVLQPGSSIKPVVAYPYAIERRKICYSSLVKDEKLEKYKIGSDGNYIAGPNNWYGYENHNMLLPDAIEWSSNCTAAQMINMITPEAAYNQVVTLQGFEHLDESDRRNAGGLSIGGLTGGVTVREMAAAYTYLGNGGKYYKPYTYYYVTDSDDNIIIDNRDSVPKEAYSPETAYIMNRLLHYNMTYCAHTNAAYARVDGWDIVGKTGTTDEDKDSWYCGTSPYASLAVWTGFDTPKTISNTSTATILFSKVMGHYLEGKKQKAYTKPGSIIAANFNPSNGAVYNVGEGTEGQFLGYYTKDNMPEDTGEYVDNYNGYYDDDEEETKATEEDEKATEKRTRSEAAPKPDEETKPATENDGDEEEKTEAPQTQASEEEKPETDE